jgi:hypothetical protein
MTTRSRPPCRPRMRGLQGKPKRLSSYTTSRDATAFIGCCGVAWSRQVGPRPVTEAPFDY